MLGQTLGNFRIIEMMGEGGMGQLYLARHVSMDRRAVVKVLRSHLLEDEAIVRRFVNEANAAAMIGHPGIVYVMDVGTLESGSPYIMMEYLEGESLASRLQQGALDMPTALSITRQIADALAAAHDKGIVHRDLKPGNVFLTPDASVAGGVRVKLLDFGIAKLLAPSHDSVATHTDIILGTPLYMSPEQCDGARVVDHRSDLYSLGCMLFELVCGRTPFEPAGAGTLIAAHLMKSPPSPRSLDPGIPAELDAMIMRLLAKMPADRFQDARELIAAIDALAGSLSGSWAALGAERISAIHRIAMPDTPAASRGRSGPGTPLPGTPLPGTPAPGPGTPASGPGTPARQPAALPQVSYPTFTAQLGAGESLIIPSLRGDRRRLWAVLAGMGVVLVVAVAVWPWSQDDGEAASRARARPAEPASAPAGDTVAPPEPAAPAAPVAAPPAAARPSPAAAPAAPAAAGTGQASEQRAAAPAPATVAVEIVSRPGSAAVYRKGKLLGRTPYRDTYPVSAERLVFVLKKPGFRDEVVEIHADRDREQVVELTRKRARRPAGGSGPRNGLRPEEGGPVDPF